jgi:predicted DNA-binding transcriptional regulator YafY
MASAELKLLAALPAGWELDAQRVSSRFHLDPVGWYRDPPRPDALPAVAQAVWDERRLAIRYESWKGLVDRVIEPLGLVLKAGEWYVVASAGREPRTYRLSNIKNLEPRDDRFTRPKNFELAEHWAESTARFESELYRGSATVRASPSGWTRLRRSSAAVAAALDRTTSRADVNGWRRVTIPIESVDHAAGELIRLGAEVEVLEPEPLRRKMQATVERLAALYLRP